MIFVTVGTERFPFDRLIRAVDELQDALQGEPVFMQTGCSTYTPSCAHQSFLSYEETRCKTREARIVIGHAGAGTLLTCAELGKVPVMMARKRSLGEHVDDHQQMLAERMAERGSILLASNPEDIRTCVLRYDEQLKSRRRLCAAEPPLSRHLREMLSEISKSADSARSSI